MLVDKLTNQCPQCFVKHMSAAIAYLSSMNLQTTVRGSDSMVCLARALINLREVASGYLSHTNLAVGFLVQAEDDGLGEARNIRLGLEYGASAPAAIDEAAEKLVSALAYAPWAMAVGHLLEAARELPEYALRALEVYAEIDTASAIEAAEVLVNDVKKEFFELPDVPSGGEGGDNTMATKKAAPAFLKKGADKKGAQADCKGGKCSGKKTCKK